MTAADTSSEVREVYLKAGSQYDASSAFPSNV